MDNRKLEHIILYILLALNLALCAVILADRGQRRRSDEEIQLNTAAALAECGIRMDADAIPVSEAAPICTMLRDSAAEGTLIREILGSASVEDLGGNILFYRSDKGQAVFRGSGELEVLFTSGAVSIRGSRVKTAERLLRKAGIEAQEDGMEGEEMVFLCCRNGYPVFNAALNFDFSDESLYMLTGVRLFDSASEENGKELCDSVSALLRFAKLVEDGAAECSEILSLTPGYLAEVVVSGKCSLRPVWKFLTDGSPVLLDAETGEILRETA